MASHIKILLSPLLLFLCIALTSCHVVRYVYWNFADVSDYKKFPADTIQPGSLPQKYPVDLLKTTLRSPQKSVKNETIDLDQYLSSQKTLAFIIIRDDTLIYEKYFNGYNKNSIIPSFSVSKSFVSALVGIAVSEGKIHDIRQPVTDYLPELKDPGFAKVTIEDLLTMRSGVKFNEGYTDPFGEAAKFYYGLNLRKYTRKLKVVQTPGSRYDYISGNTEILGMILEKATGERLAQYFEEKLWKPMGAANIATWSLDSKKNREVKAFCCINAVPEDFALFGQLYLHRGAAEGNQVVPEQWINESLTIRNDSRDSQGFPYTYLWRVMDDGSFFAKGILGQFIYVCPAKKIVILRMGEKAGNTVWPEFFRKLTDQL
jgi:CubicO group peptidase (beta-lactamase class C family)